MPRHWIRVACCLVAAPALAADLPPLTSPESLPAWARTGRFRPARWDGGLIEAEKGRLSGWPNYTEADERGVMAATRAWYNPRTVAFLKTAHINWAWVTWSVGFSHETEAAQRDAVRRYIAECHRQGIRVAAYFSVANMFWADMFERVPASRHWVELLPDGSPRFYKPPHRYMANIANPEWLAYTRERVRAAMEAGADSFWVDNTFQYHGAQNVQRFLNVVYEEAARFGRKIVLMSNYNRRVYTWARYQNGVTTEDGQEPGWYPEDPEPRRLATNAGLLRYHWGISEGWRPVSAEYGGRHRGDRFTDPMAPAKWQLSIAECAAFQAGFEPFFEGLFLRDLHNGVSAALEKLAAIGKYNAFLERHEEHYTDPRPAAPVAVLAGESDSLVPALNGMAARNVQYDVLFGYQEPALAALKRYRAIAAPEPGGFSPRMKETLARYAREGGTVTANLDELAGLAAAVTPVEIEAPATVLYNVVRQERPARLVVHLLNYAQKPVPAIRVRVRGAAGKVRLLSPDFEGVHEAPVKNSAFEVPELRTYTVAVITRP